MTNDELEAKKGMIRELTKESGKYQVTTPIWIVAGLDYKNKDLIINAGYYSHERAIARLYKLLDTAFNDEHSKHKDIERYHVDPVGGSLYYIDDKYDRQDKVRIIPLTVYSDKRKDDMAIISRIMNYGSPFEIKEYFDSAYFHLNDAINHMQELCDEWNQYSENHPYKFERKDQKSYKVIDSTTKKVYAMLFAFQLEDDENGYEEE